MSESVATRERGASRAANPAAPRRRSPVRLAVLAVLLVLLLIAPLYVDEFWLRTGFAVWIFRRSDRLACAPECRETRRTHDDKRRAEAPACE